MSEKAPRGDKFLKEIGFSSSDFNSSPENLRPEDWYDSIDQKINDEHIQKMAEKEHEKEKATIIDQMKKKGQESNKNSLIDIFNKVGLSLSRIDEEKKPKARKEVLEKIKQNIKEIANDQATIELMIVALETTYLEEIKKQYDIAEKEEDRFERVSPDDYWTTQSLKSIELREARMLAQQNLEDARTMVAEIVQVLRLFEKELN